MDQLVKSDRQNKVLSYALNQIKHSPILPYISRIYLYGSCARGQEKYSSDVDLLIELSDDFPASTALKKDILRLKHDAMTANIHDPETDLKFVKGTEWEHSGMLFYKNIRKDGKQIWLYISELPLLLTLENETDERVEEALETMMENYKW